MLCQPFSGAGKRLGTEDPRHLFPYVANLAAMFRPPLLLLENVRGHLSLGFDVVLAELDRIGYDVRWTLLRAADVGAPHGRSRLWIAARDRAVGGWPMPSNDPSALAEDGGWVDPASGLFGAIEAQRPGTAGVMVRGLRWDSDAVSVNAGLTLLKTPTSQLAINGGSQHPDKRKAGGHGPTLADEVEHLLPTPTSRDHKGANQRQDDTCLHGALLPTPRATDGTKGGPNQRGSSGDLMLPSAVVQLLPTPVAAADSGGQRGSSAGWGLRDESRAIANAWGPYAAAIARWEYLTRPAPAPTEQGRSGPRLSPAFVEWLMGVPSGWVTDVPGITRNNALKALGNGVVPQCAAAAYTLLGVADLYVSEVAA